MVSKTAALVCFVLTIVISASVGWWVGKNQEQTISALPKTISEKLRPLEKYSIENLSKRTVTPPEIKWIKLQEAECKISPKVISSKVYPVT